MGGGSVTRCDDFRCREGRYSFVCEGPDHPGQRREAGELYVDEERGWRWVAARRKPQTVVDRVIRGHYPPEDVSGQTIHPRCVSCGVSPFVSAEQVRALIAAHVHVVRVDLAARA